MKTGKNRENYQQNQEESELSHSQHWHPCPCPCPCLSWLYLCILNVFLINKFPQNFKWDFQVNISVMVHLEKQNNICQETHIY